MRGLSPREERMAALLLLAAAVALVWFAIIVPIANGFRDRALQRDLLLATYARDDRIIGELPSVIRAAAAQRRDQRTFRLVATEAAGATSALVERLGDMVTAAGGTLVGVENLASPPGIVRARVQCRLDTPQLADVLKRVQNGVPILTVDALAIDASGGSEEAHPGLLDVRLEVSAYLPAAASR